MCELNKKRQTKCVWFHKWIVFFPNEQPKCRTQDVLFVVIRSYLLIVFRSLYLHCKRISDVLATQTRSNQISRTLKHIDKCWMSTNAHRFGVCQFCKCKPTTMDSFRRTYVWNRTEQNNPSFNAATFSIQLNEVKSRSFATLIHFS